MADNRDRQLTANFKLSEFKCKNGRDVPPELLANVQRLADNLQVLRTHLGRPIVIMSGYRDAEYNRRAGGAAKSRHVTAEAADIRVPGMTAREVHDAVLLLIASGVLHNGGVGLYTRLNGWVHYDVRPSAARWEQE